MKLIRPFRGLRPDAHYLEQIICPPYDIISTKEAKALAKGKPYNLLHVTKPEIDLSPDVDVYSDIVYETAAKNFHTLLTKKVLQQDATENYYVYRLTQGTHQQTGLVATVSLDAYRKGIVKKHETTRVNKEEDRVKNIEALNAQVSPILLAHKPESDITQLLAVYTQRPSVYQITYRQVQHEFWVIDEPDDIHTLTREFNKLDALYIADGHHRIAAANRVAEMRNDEENELANYVLATIFSADQLEILGYHRVFKDLNGLNKEQFFHALDPIFNVQAVERQVQPKRKGQLGMYIDHQWYTLDIKPTVCDKGDPSQMLEVNFLRENIAKPILDIIDPRTDIRVDFVGGLNALNELEQRVNDGEATVAFSLYPTSIEELMSVSDKGEIMPPKSTWFEPKLADGLIAYLLHTNNKLS